MIITHLKGFIAAPFTPMDPNGELNLSLIPAYYSFLKHNNIKGAFICGSTGEGVNLTYSEKIEVAEAWATCTKGDNDFNVMMLVGGTSIKECISLSKKAFELQLSSISFTAPFYFSPANVGVLAKACAEVAAAVPDMPFYYYHIPVLNKCSFPMLDLLKAVDGKIPNFCGVKYTHEDFMDFLSCMSYKDGKYDMLWGRDENTLAALALGAVAAVGSTFNYAAPLYYEMMEAYEKNDLIRARKLQQQSIDMIRLLGKYGGIATGKAFMKAVGIDCGGFRLPVSNMSASDFELFKEDLYKISFDTFKSKLP